MRWLLAGVSFAFLVAVALSTVAAKADNIRTRAHIEQVSMDVEICRLEVERRLLERSDSPEDLAWLWRQFQSRALGDWR